MEWRPLGLGIMILKAVCSEDKKADRREEEKGRERRDGKFCGPCPPALNQSTPLHCFPSGP